MLELTTNYEPQNAYWAARAAMAAYNCVDSPGDIRTACECWGWQLLHVDPRAFIAETADYRVVAFRGTNPRSLQDIVCDARAALNRWPPGGRVHSGFATETLAFFARSGEFTRTEKPIVLTGHSLGGAMATLAAGWIRYGGRHQRMRVYTFGSPRVGDGAFAKWYESQNVPTYRHRHNNDLVSRIPVPLPDGLRTFAAKWFRRSYVPGGYRHVGELHYYDVDGRYHYSPGWLFRLADRIDGRIRDLFSFDGIGDHSIHGYAECARKHWQGA